MIWLEEASDAQDFVVSRQIVCTIHKSKLHLIFHNVANAQLAVTIK